MLTHLSVQQFAVDSRAALALDRGVNVVCCETGSGNGLLIDELLLLS